MDKALGHLHINTYRSCWATETMTLPVDSFCADGRAKGCLELCNYWVSRVLVTFTHYVLQHSATPLLCAWMFPLRAEYPGAKKSHKLTYCVLLSYHAQTRRALCCLQTAWPGAWFHTPVATGQEHLNTLGPMMRTPPQCDLHRPTPRSASSSVMLILLWTAWLNSLSCDNLLTCYIIYHIASVSKVQNL